MPKCFSKWFQFCTSPSNVLIWVFQVCHTFARIRYCHSSAFFLFSFSPSNRNVIVSHYGVNFFFSSWLILFNIFSWACHMYILLDEIYVEIFCPWLFHGFFEAWEFFIIIENLRVLIIEAWEFFMNLRYKSPIR